MNSRKDSISKWKAENAEHIKEYRKEYYKKYGNFKQADKSQGKLRECKCGTVALTEEDLALFVKDPNSKHGYRNKCLKCSAKESRKGTPRSQPKRTCPQCKKTFIGELGIEKGFRRTSPSRDKVVGGLALLCKVCEFPEELYYNIDGKYIPKESSSSLHAKPIEVI